MSELIKLEIKDMSEFRIIGKTVRPAMDMKENPIPAFWEKCFSEGMFSVIEALGDSVTDPAYVGLMTDWLSSDGKFSYVCGMLCKPGTEVPEGFDHRDFPGSSVAVGWIQGPEKDNYGPAHGFTLKAMAEKGYASDEKAGWCMELYACPRFTQADEDGNVILDYYIPCVPVV